MIQVMRIIPMARFWLAMLASLGLSLPVSAKDKPPLVLQPSTQWVVNYEAESCLLYRGFGEGDQSVRVEFTFYQPAEYFSLLVSGKPLKFTKKRPALSYQFNPGSAAIPQPSALSATLADGTPGMIIRARFKAFDGVLKRNDRKYSESLAAEQAETFTPPDLAREREVNQLLVGGPIDQNLAIEIGSMGPPMVAVRKCLDGLLTHWGIDPVAHKTLTRSAYPVGNPQEWIQSKDFPEELWKNGRSDVVSFRLLVDPDGAPKSCTIISLDSSKEFNDLSCNIIMRNAKLHPAIDAGGKSIQSYYINTIRWQSMDWYDIYLNKR